MVISMQISNYFHRREEMMMMNKLGVRDRWEIRNERATDYCALDYLKICRAAQVDY